jgi:hypothetical protein
MPKRKPKDEWLDTLLPARQVPATALIPGGGAVTPSDCLLEIPLDSLDANPYQTRTSLDDGSLQELANSIGMMGLLEPRAPPCQHDREVNRPVRHPPFRKGRERMGHPWGTATC